jgi:molybdenum cofactor synthesis domain-containing protein
LIEMKVAYYPGCSLDTTGIEFRLSTAWCASKVGLDLWELPGWNCCGASSAHAKDHLLSLALPARNLALAEKEGMDVAVPCAACYSRFKTVEAEVRQDEKIQQRVAEAIDMDYHAANNTKSLLEVFVDGVGLERIESDVVKPLNGLKVACYYGCYLVRPAKLGHFDRAEDPQSMDGLISSLGGTPVDWPHKTECCGENIQRAGHELTAGERVAPKGLVLNAEILERIAACGIENILVHQIPRIYVINTGSELLLPGSPIKTGQIYNSNRSLLSAKVAGSGAIPVLADSIIKDDLQQIVNEIEKATPVSDMIIISGGTGNGVYDLVYNAFEYLNASPLFKGIDITPGKGTSAALFNGKLLYNLSGNPHAAGILFEVLIKPALLKLKGDLFSAREWFDIQLDSPIKKIKPYRRLCQGEMLIEQGSVYAQPVSGNNNPIKNISLILDIRAGQGAKGDMVRAIILN